MRISPGFLKIAKEELLIDAPYGIIVENGLYVVVDPANSKIYWYNNKMVQVREETLGYVPREITVENGLYVVSDYTNSKIYWYDNNF